MGIACGIYMGGKVHTRFCWGKHERNRPLGIPRWRQDDNIKMNFKERGWQGTDWIHLAHGRGMWQVHINMVMQGI